MSFNTRTFVMALDLRKPDAFRVTSVEDCWNEIAKLDAAIEEANQQGAVKHVTNMFRKWIKGWKAIAHKMSIDYAAPTEDGGKGPSAQERARKQRKREQSVQVRNQAKGRKGK